MNRYFAALTLLFLTFLSMPTQADSVSLAVGQPGFYGRLDLGGYPAPQLVAPQPVIVQRSPYAGAPMYLYAPPKHIHHWSKYCGRYGACGTPVYFVQEGWYNQVYVPQYYRGHGHHDHHDDDDDDHHHHHHHD